MRLRTLVLCAAALLHAESVAGVKWATPAGWKAESGSRPMRASTYNIPPVAGDHETAECIVYFFGLGQGGPVDLNIERWKSQFRAPGGKPADAKVGKRMVHGLPVTTIDVSGEYSGMGGPLAKQTVLKPTFRLLGAIVENPGGNLFIKFTGEAKTMAANQQKFEQLVASFEPDKH